MHERPILFSAPMVRAILEGRKTQTRRLVKPQPPPGWARHAWYSAPLYGWTAEGVPANEWHTARFPYGSTGGRLWVRETWRVEASFNDIKPSEVPEDAHVWYEATDEWRYSSAGVLRPSLFMMPWMSRITLEVTGVRVERLQDISEEDARAEGVVPYTTNTLRMVDPEAKGPLYRRSFEELWDELNAARAPWASNPWVWVVEFKRLVKAQESDRNEWMDEVAP